MKRLKNLRAVLALLIACIGVSGCGEFTYGVDLVNHGQKGILVLSFGGFRKYEEREVFLTYRKTGEEIRNPGTKGLAGIELVKRLYPSLPSKYRDTAAAFGRFPGKPRSLPDSAEVIWQLAELRECRTNTEAQSEKTVKELKALGRDPEYHRIASGCTWKPLPDKIFRKTVDLTAIRETDAYKQAHGRNFRLNITFEFMDEELRVIPEAYGINRWK